MLKHMQFGKRRETLDTEQMNQLDETLDWDLVAIELERAQLTSTSTPASDDTRQKPKRLPRTEVHRALQNIVCACGCERLRRGARGRGHA